MYRAIFTVKDCDQDKPFCTGWRDEENFKETIKKIIDDPTITSERIVRIEQIVDVTSQILLSKG